MNETPIEDRPTLKDAGLDFQRFAYFTRPFAAIPRPLAKDLSSRLPADEDLHWVRFEMLLERLKSGDFSAAEDILSMCRKTENWRMKDVATRVLGHAGTVACFRHMREELEQHPMRRQERIDVAYRESVLLYCRAFALWGRLDVVPVLMDQYLTLRLKKTPEISSLPILMAELLMDDRKTMIAHEPPEDSLEDYLNLVMNQYDEVTAKHGSEKVFIYRGDIFSVRAIAERMRHLTTRYPAAELARLRERFEPATGIDCSVIFSGERVSTLAAATIAESFLESDEAKKFEPGKRYFFGHPLPE
ncbi:MAG TPA: hypothetical protein VFZ09_21190 [Archangium sp.]|uniref:hypothetical protein n=1 Tax=Archangium sp. TaxID=1872627 RepID=UPI002E301DAC|nr:hypothetical protein [Archangium sp.]HEX5748770.1 hypothetical protein [Archangium sp.]